MDYVKHVVLDCQTYAEAVKDKVTVVELEDLTGKVPHVGYGGASKSSYSSPITGRTVYVLERNGSVAPDAYVNDVWLFMDDFSAEDAAKFLSEWKG
jgi:hypothetical protein